MSSLISFINNKLMYYHGISSLRGVGTSLYPWGAEVLFKNTTYSAKRCWGGRIKNTTFSQKSVCVCPYNPVSAICSVMYTTGEHVFHINIMKHPLLFYYVVYIS